MIVKLRKRHFYTWVVLALATPVMIILAYTNVRSISPDDYKLEQAEAFAEVIGTSQSEHLLLNLRKQGVQYQMEAVILKPIQAANTMLQMKLGQKDVVLGRLGSKGLYRFNVPDNVPINKELQVSVFDQIKKVEIEKINISL